MLVVGLELRPCSGWPQLRYLDFGRQLSVVWSFSFSMTLGCPAPAILLLSLGVWEERISSMSFLLCMCSSNRFSLHLRSKASLGEYSPC